MRAFFLFLAIGLLCIGCSQPDRKQATLLERKLETTPAPSAAFDSLLQEIRTLSASQRVAVLLSPSLCSIENREAVVRQVPYLTETLPLASKQERRQLLLRLMEIYKQQINYRHIPDARNQCLKRCEELETEYSLSQKERWKVMEAKALVLDQAGQQNLYMPIWFKLLEEHRREGETALVVKDLLTIAACLENLGDSEKSLSTYREAYQLSLANGLTEQRNQSLIPVINLTSQLGHDEEMLSYYRQVGIDSLAAILPSAYRLLSECYIRLHKTDSARLYLQKEILSSSNSEYNATLPYIYIAKTFVDENREDSASYYLHKAMSTSNREAIRTHTKQYSFKLSNELLGAYPAYATLLQQNGKTQQASEAFALVEPLMKKPVKTIALFERQIDALSHYASFCQATRQYQKGLELLVRRDSLRQLKTDIQEKRSGQNIVERFKMQELLYTIDLQKAELSYSQRVLIAIAGASLILLSAIAVLTRMYRQRRRQLSAIISKDREIEQLRQAASGSVPAASALSPAEELFRAAEQRVTSEKLFLNKELSLELLAHDLGTNRTYLSACVNTCSGGNFNQWINNYRIAYVLERIDTAPNLLQLASEAGFLSPDSFYRNFKRCTQMTTSQYLKEKGKTPD